MLPWTLMDTIPAPAVMFCCFPASAQFYNFVVFVVVGLASKAITIGFIPSLLTSHLECGPHLGQHVKNNSETKARLPFVIQPWSTRVYGLLLATPAAGRTHRSALHPLTSSPQPPEWWDVFALFALTSKLKVLQTLCFIRGDNLLSVWCKLTLMDGWPPSWYIVCARVCVCV